MAHVADNNDPGCPIYGLYLQASRLSEIENKLQDTYVAVNIFCAKAGHLLGFNLIFRLVMDDQDQCWKILMN